MNLSLEGKNAVICGSSQGIGFAIAEELALMGANCILLARNEKNLQIAVSQLDTAIRQLHRYYAVDFNDEMVLKNLAQSIIKEQPVHILVQPAPGATPKHGSLDALQQEGCGLQFVNSEVGVLVR